ncbi:hypothetical protein LMG26845_06203 [Achromobacter insuavis]|uniref:Uncharacterized protein n=1 Tax=Achromobacter insuavis TaxID=1287735 RepID=A0A6J5BVJ2_9BURK|nr:hypothetical protein LMG26845_06203 [Achromobacter insuavis]CUJ64697.1 Uncharacterised protein [Achromobacter sp. 2789STDY5608628]
MHGVDHLGHRRTAALGHVRRTGRQLVGLARVVGVLLDGRGQLLHRGRGLFQRSCLLLGAAGQVGVARGDLVRTGIDFVDAAAHRGHRARQAFLHALERGEQLADLVGIADFDAGGQIPAGNAVEVMAGILERLQHAATQEHIGGEHQQRGDHAAGAHRQQHELVAHLGHLERVQHLAGAPEIKPLDGAGEAPFERVLHLLHLRLVGRHVGLLQRGGQRLHALLDQGAVRILDFLEGLGRLGRPGQGLEIVEFRLALVLRRLGALEQAGGLARQALRQQRGLADAAHDVGIIGRGRAAQAIEGVFVARHDAAQRIVQFLRLLDFRQRRVADAQRQHAQCGSDHQHE